jgi:hypothetical protein
MTTKQQAQEDYLTFLNIISIKDNIKKVLEQTEKDLLNLNDALLLNVYGLPEDKKKVEAQYVKETIDKVLVAIYEATNFNRPSPLSHRHHLD